VLGLPDGVRACLFDLDGVLTETAEIHAAAWKEMFDEFLSRYPLATQDSRPFDVHGDYEDYVDGKTRLDGVRDFLASRHVHLPEGGPGDPPSALTVNGLATRKNEVVLRRIHDTGVQAYPGSVAYVRAARDAGLRRAVVSSSANCQDVLRSAGIAKLFEARVDGVVAEREHLKGKPAPDTYLAAARMLEVAPAAASVFEDSLAGVESGRAGRFGFVVGVDRAGQARALLSHGANRVVRDLSELMGRGAR
jgi:beta-phosphoglucomutase family hydrolase